MYRNYRPFPAFRLVGKLLLDSATFTGENPGTGYGLDDPTTFLKCDLTPWGFHAMVVSSAGGTYFIDPYSLGDRVHYSGVFQKGLSSASRQNLRLGHCRRDEQPGL